MDIIRKKAKILMKQIAGISSEKNYKTTVVHRQSQWYVLKLMVINDVRIVYAPPKAIGRYGGQEENWQWPSHAGDFAFLRAYVTPHGKGAEYSVDNVPYCPEKHLSINLDGIKENDFVFIMGFPGNSNRYTTSFEIDYEQNLNLPWEIEAFQQKFDIVKKYSDNNPQIRLKLAGEYEMLSSRLKNRKGTFEGFIKSGLLPKKRVEEQALLKFIETDESLKSEYGDVLTKLKEVQDRNNQTAKKEFVLAKLMMFCNLFNTARDIGELSLQPEKSTESIEATKYYIRMRELSQHIPSDRDVFKLVLKDALLLPRKLQLQGISRIFNGRNLENLDEAIKTYADEVYSGTCLTDTAKVISLVGKDTQSLLALNDPMINFIAALLPDLDWLNERNHRFRGEIGKLQERYRRLMKLWKKENYYPDSDLSLRLSYGNVKGYCPGDAITYSPFTRLGGMIEKNKNEPPFNVPQKLINLYKNKDFKNYAESTLNDDIPVAFLSNLDIIGGNSGSPVLNRKGQLVGVVYDRNYEAMIAEYAFLPKVNRTMSVDIRYILFILEKFSEADSILKELGM